MKKWFLVDVVIDDVFVVGGDGSFSSNIKGLEPTIDEILEAYYFLYPM